MTMRPAHLAQSLEGGFAHLSGSVFEQGCQCRCPVQTGHLADGGNGGQAHVLRLHGLEYVYEYG